MAEPKKAAKTAPAPLLRPAESTDPTVHQLMAQRQILLHNIETAAADLATIEDAQVRLVEVNRQLGELGYE